MKTAKLYLPFILILICIPQCFAQGFNGYFYPYHGATLVYWIYYPDNYDPDVNHPVIVWQPGSLALPQHPGDSNVIQYPADLANLANNYNCFIIVPEPIKWYPDSGNFNKLHWPDYNTPYRTRIYQDGSNAVYSDDELGWIGIGAWLGQSLGNFYMGPADSDGPHSGPDGWFLRAFCSLMKDFKDANFRFYTKSDFSEYNGEERRVNIDYNRVYYMGWSWGCIEGSSYLVAGRDLFAGAVLIDCWQSFALDKICNRFSCNERLELSEKLASRYSHIPVVLISGNVSEQYSNSQYHFDRLRAVDTYNNKYLVVADNNGHSGARYVTFNSEALDWRFDITNHDEQIILWSSLPILEDINHTSPIKWLLQRQRLPKEQIPPDPYPNDSYWNDNVHYSVPNKSRHVYQYLHHNGWARIEPNKMNYFELVDRDSNAVLLMGGKEIKIELHNDGNLIWDTADNNSHTFTGNNQVYSYIDSDSFSIRVATKAGGLYDNQQFTVCYSLPRVRNITADINYVNIQDAINQASNGAEIVVNPGVYKENVSVQGIPQSSKTLNIHSIDPNDWDIVAATVIDNNGATNTVQLGYNAYVNFSGFTITGGYRGLYFNNTHSTARRCVIEDCNTGVEMSSSTTANLYNSIIRHNKIFGIMLGSMGFNNNSINNNLIYDNNEGIYFQAYANSNMHNNTIVNNSGHGIDCNTLYNTSCNVKNSILWNNGDDLFGNCNATYSRISDCNDVNETNHNICSDPCFVGADNNDFHISPYSPCIDAGDPCGNYNGEVDIDGDLRVLAGRVDIGADEALRVHNETAREWYEYIQDAIDDANNYDEIVVYPWTYYENINFNGKYITLRSVDTNDLNTIKATILDGNGVGAVVEMNSSYSNLKGLTITNGQRGVYCSARWPTISNCIIRDNNGEGIYTEHSKVTVTNSLIYDNNKGLAFQDANVGGGTVQNNTIVHNTSFGIQVISGNSPWISNCILWNNNDDLSGCTATYSDIENGDGCGQNGNICSDPYFVDEYSNNFHLKTNSPCVDTGNPNTGYSTDIDGDRRGIYSRVDMGADEVKKNYLSPGAHWWKLNETYGTTAYDSVDSNNGTFNGYDPCWVSGYINGAADFDGVSDYFSVTDLDGLYSPDNYAVFSVAGWFRTTQSTGIQTIVGNWSQKKDGVAPGMFISVYFGWQVLVENNRLIARFGNYSTVTDINGTQNVSNGQWHHFALVFNTQFSNSCLYLDGQQEAMKITHGLTSSKFRIGDGSYYSGDMPVLEGGPFCGMIDDIMIFNAALTDDEVEQIYNQDVREKAFNPYPANGAWDVALNVVLSWNCGAHATSQDIYFGLSYNAVNSATHNSPEWMGNQTANSWDVTNYDPAGLTFSTVYYWRIDEVNTVGTTKGDVWSFTTATGKAFNPCPSNGQTNIGLTPVLSWSPGSMAISHDIYFGKNYIVISNANTGYAEYKGRQDVNSWQASCDANDAVYFWRIDEISGTTVTKGDVWCFSTGHYSNLISWFKLDEWIDDSTGNHDDGDFGDSTDGDFVAGIIDNALLLNYGYGYVDSLNDYFGPSSTFTISGWFNTTQTAGIQTIVGQWSQRNTGYNMYYGWQVIVYNNKVVARFPYEDLSITDVSGTSNVTDGKWHHFALVYNNNYGYMNINLYVDGRAEASYSGGCTWSVYDTKFRIGDGSYVIYGNPTLQGGQFYGKIDQVKLFDTNLISSQVQQLYQEGTKVHNITRDKWYVYIQKAVADACSSDEIAAYPWVYKENVSVGTWQYSKTYNIHSIDPNNWDIVAATVIDNNGATNTVNFGLNTSGNFSGFTITGGHRGLYLSNANFAVRRCIIEDCNRGVEMSCATANLYNSIIRHNRNYGITLGMTTNSIKNNLIYDNNEGVYFQNYVTGNTQNNTIVNNSSHGIYCGPYYASCNVKNSILWNNGDDLFGNCTATYCCIEDGDGCGQNGNICSDPCFVDTNLFHIGSNSPCIDVGDPNINYSGEKDIDNDIRVIDISGKGDGNNDIDIGADEYNPGL
ncbi:MAG: LamG-like jellyroll fold domain-containing protein [Sedimentisphaerales bacterium]